MGDVNMMITKLASLRENQELTQADLGIIIGVNRVSISRWENGIEIIPIRKAIKIVQYFNTNLDYLFGLSSDKEKNYNNIDLNIASRRIIHFRKLFKFTLRDLAKELNTTSSTISSYETGKTLLLSAFAYHIAEKYNVSIDWLMGFSDKMYINKRIVYS